MPSSMEDRTVNLHGALMAGGVEEFYKRAAWPSVVLELPDSGGDFDEEE